MDDSEGYDKTKKYDESYEEIRNDYVLDSQTSLPNYVSDLTVDDNKSLYDIENDIERCELDLRNSGFRGDDLLKIMDIVEKYIRRGV